MCSVVASGHGPHRESLVHEPRMECEQKHSLHRGEHDQRRNGSNDVRLHASPLVNLSRCGRVLFGHYPGPAVTWRLPTTSSAATDAVEHGPTKWRLARC